jgi:hypothetical protein
LIQVIRRVSHLRVIFLSLQHAEGVARPQDQSRRTVQLHVETTGLTVGACNVIVLQEAQPSPWSYQIFHL